MMHEASWLMAHGLERIGTALLDGRLHAKWSLRPITNFHSRITAKFLRFAFRTLYIVRRLIAIATSCKH
eukprot:scaffold313438_cov33-Tisochrysis_lutea.AAC.2